MKLDWLRPSPFDKLCPVCQGHRASTLLALNTQGKDYLYVRCDNCRSVLPSVFENEDDQLGGYSIGRAEEDSGLKNYVEVGAGLDSLLGPVLTVKPQPKGTLLDIGCGFGYMVAGWNILCHGAGEAHGIELASYGHWGRELLGISISHQLLEDDVELQTKQFDVVFSSEVIEHVADPGPFLRDLGARLKPEGILVLTTPDADFVRPDSSGPELLAALSPGFHQYLLHRQRFEQLLQEAGFKYTRVIGERERLVAWASNSPLTTEELTAAKLRERTYDVLSVLAESSNDWVSGGALYRMFREKVNEAAFTEARPLLDKLDALIGRQLGEFDRWSEKIDNFIAQSLQAHQFIMALPCYLGNYLFYRGMFFLNQGQPLRAVGSFGMSSRLNNYWVEFHPNIAQEANSLLATTWFHLGLAMTQVGAQASAAIKARCLDKLPYGKMFEDRWKKEIIWPE